MPPGVGGAVVEGFKSFRLRVEPPHPAGDGDAALARSPGRADQAGAGGAAAAVQPAVGAPPQAVGEVVVVLLRHVEAVEHHRGGRVGPVVAIEVGHEEELRRAHQPGPAAAHLDAGEHLDVVGEDGPLLRLAVAVGVLEDQDPVAIAEVEPGRALGVGVVLGDPEPPPGVPRHGDRVADLGLGGEDRDLEPLRHAEARSRPVGGHDGGPVDLGVEDLGIVVGRRGGGEGQRDQRGQREGSTLHGPSFGGRPRCQSSSTANRASRGSQPEAPTTTS